MAMREAASQPVELHVRTNSGPTGRENELEKLLKAYR